MVSLQDGPSLPARGGLWAAQGLVDHALRVLYCSTCLWRGRFWVHLRSEISLYLEMIIDPSDLTCDYWNCILVRKVWGHLDWSSLTFSIHWVKTKKISSSFVFCFFRGPLSTDRDMNLVFQYQVTVKPRDPDHFSQIWHSCSRSPPDLVLLTKVLFTKCFQFKRTGVKKHITCNAVCRMGRRL